MDASQITGVSIVKMSAKASHITSLSIVYSTVYSGTDQRNYQISSPGEFAGHRWVPRTKDQ